MKLYVAGMGIGVAGTRFGVSFAKVAHMSFRNAPDEGSRGLHVYDHFDVGSEGQVTVASVVWTEWFTVNASRYPWLRKHQELVGKQAIIQVKGTSLGLGALTVDVDIRVLDKFHNVAHRFEAYQIPVEHSSVQAGSIGIEGEIRDYDLRVQRQMERMARTEEEQSDQ